MANKVWELHRLAELKPKEEEDWKAKATAALKDMLGMTQGSSERRLEEAEKPVDPTIYPFHRRR